MLSFWSKAQTMISRNMLPTGIYIEEIDTYIMYVVFALLLGGNFVLCRHGATVNFLARKLRR